MKRLSLMAAGVARAEDTVKIGYIDPLSGGGASVGEIGLKHFQWLTDQINASGGLLGKKVVQSHRIGASIGRAILSTRPTRSRRGGLYPPTAAR